MSKNKRRMRLSEDDLLVVLSMRGYDLYNNPYKYSVDSQSTYRLTLSREEEDVVAKDRVRRAFNQSEDAAKIVNKPPAYLSRLHGNGYVEKQDIG